MTVYVIRLFYLLAGIMIDTGHSVISIPQQYAISLQLAIIIVVAEPIMIYRRYIIDPFCYSHGS